MKVLITGANGQLGRSLLKLHPEFPDMVWIPTDYPELNITDEKAIELWLSKSNAGAVVNCAGYTAVDQAESEPDQAYRINTMGPGYLAQAAKQAGIPLIHLSTDYVFDGVQTQPYRESDTPRPTSVYGKTKLAGEERIRASGCTYVIIRTSWLYSEFGKNFFLTMLRLGREKEQIGVVSDQTGSPTYAGDLARAIILVLKQLKGSANQITKPGIFHYCNQGIATWFDFATRIMDLAQLPCTVNAIQTKDYPLPASRPAYSVLDTTLIHEAFGITIPHWTDGLYSCYKEYLNNNKP